MAPGYRARLVLACNSVAAGVAGPLARPARGPMVTVTVGRPDGALGRAQSRSTQSAPSHSAAQGHGCRSAGPASESGIPSPSSCGMMDS